MDSVWKKDIDAPKFDQLRDRVKTDVLVIGGGLAGILITHVLQKAGVDCLLVEADRICAGVTENTTAKITLAHGLVYHGMESRLGHAAAKQYLAAQARAIEAYGRIAREIDCDFEIKDAYLYSRTDRAAIEQECRALNRLGCRAELTEAKELPFPVADAVRIPDQAQIHPLKFAYALAKTLPIRERSKILHLAPNQAVTAHGEVIAKKTVIATHFPILNKHGMYPIKLYQSRSYVLALAGASDIHGMYIDADKHGITLRTWGDLLILGGGAHRTGKKSAGWRELEDFARRYYPDAEIRARWATQDCMTLDGIPYIGQYAKSTPDLYVATGFHKWGMTSSMVAAELLADLVQGKAHANAPLFSPSRSILHPRLAVNLFESVVNLLTPTVPRCPHLGCALKYNPNEHSWDCPCHGSRFSESGKLINNPATDDHKRIGK